MADDGLHLYLESRGGWSLAYTSLASLRVTGLNGAPGCPTRRRTTPFSRWGLVPSRWWARFWWPGDPPTPSVGSWLRWRSWWRSFTRATPTPPPLWSPADGPTPSPWWAPGSVTGTGTSC